jgi:hypothetical protein
MLNWSLNYLQGDEGSSNKHVCLGCYDILLFLEKIEDKGKVVMYLIA